MTRPKAERRGWTPSILNSTIFTSTLQTLLHISNFLVYILYCILLLLIVLQPTENLIKKDPHFKEVVFQKIFQLQLCWYQ